MIKYPYLYMSILARKTRKRKLKRRKTYRKKKQTKKDL